MIQFIATFLACVGCGLLMWWSRDKHWRDVVAKRDTQWQADIATLETKHRAEMRRMQSDVRNVALQNSGLINENAQLRQALTGALAFSDTQVIDDRYFEGSMREHVLQSAMHKSAGRIANAIVIKARVETEPNPSTRQTTVRTSVHLSDIWDLR